jgi:general secretion pathway protein A
MYEAYWQLTQKPFQDGWTAAAYYPAETHQGALLKLRYALEQGSQCATLTGPSGIGKTLLLQLLTQQLSEQFSPISYLTFPALPASDFLAYLAEELSQQRFAETPTTHQSLRRIESALQAAVTEKRCPLLIIDEAQLIQEKQAWEYLRLLLTQLPPGENPVRLVMIGHATLLKQLERMPSFDERVSVKCQLHALDQHETAGYVQHRLRAAGTTRDLLDQAAYETLYELTSGIPRRINRLCDLALLVGYAQERNALTVDLLESVNAELLQAVVT